MAFWLVPKVMYQYYWKCMPIELQQLLIDRKEKPNDHNKREKFKDLNFTLNTMN